MSKLSTLITNYSNNNLVSFLRSKISTFKPDDEDLMYLFNDEVYEKYEAIDKIGEATIENDDLIVITSKTTDPLTEKTGKKRQYEIAKKILKEEVKDAALFVFYDEEGNFRFSFIKANYNDNKRELTSFKRYSYFVTPRKTNKTFIGQIGGCDFNSLDNIIEAFSVEPLNKQFYQEIAKAFYGLIGGKVKIGSKNQSFNTQLKLPSTPIEEKKVHQEFGVRLIGRTIFCWFLKNKKSENGLALIPEEWLSSKTVITNENNGANYYHAYLEKLFFLTLNKSIGDRAGYDLPDTHTQIPYLNGGLFEAHTDDFFVNGMANYGLVIPNQWFSDLFQVLEQYNFTIDENSVNDAEVSIDPEMLGTIFENLLAEIDPDTEKSARKATGSFYTPREIVDYMVEQSLTQYLKTKTGIEDEEKLLKLYVEDGENPFNDKETNSILEALSEVKILDPACGSGAFPMGALHKIIVALKILDKGAVWWKNRQLKGVSNALARKILKEKLDAANSDYIRKLGVIQNSIYGVDIQPIATEISKLRSFLSLVIDENIDDDAENRGIEPLPNLEFKFVTANTLIGLPEEGGQQGLFDSQEQLEELTNLRIDYLQSSGKKKESIKKKFLKVQKQIFANSSNIFGDPESRAYKLSSWNPFKNEASTWFDPKWMFGIVDFDILIGNPPYKIVKSSNTESRILNSYKGYFTSDFKINLYALFYEKCIKISKVKGLISLIIPDSSINLPAFKKLRKYILETGRVISVSYFDEDVFENATVGKSVIIASQTSCKNNNFDFIKFLRNQECTKEKIQLKYVLNDDNHKFNITSGDLKVLNLLKKIKNVGYKVEDFFDVFDGINPGSEFIKNEFISPQYIDVLSKKIIDGKDFSRFSTISWSKQFIYYSEKKVLEIKKILSTQNLDFTARIIKRTNFFEKEKIVTRQTADSIIATLDTENFYVKNSVHSTILKNEFENILTLQYLLGVYNSKLIEWYYKTISLESGRVFPQVKIGVLRNLPIFKPTVKQLNQITTCVDEVMNTFDELHKIKLINKIDLIIYKCYKINYDEIKLIDPNFELTRNEYVNYNELEFCNE